MPQAMWGDFQRREICTLQGGSEEGLVLGQAEVEKRRAWNGVWYTIEQFEDYYGNWCEQERVLVPQSTDSKDSAETTATVQPKDLQKNEGTGASEHSFEGADRCDMSAITSRARQDMIEKEWDWYWS